MSDPSLWKLRHWVDVICHCAQDGSLVKELRKAKDGFLQKLLMTTKLPPLLPHLTNNHYQNNLSKNSSKMALGEGQTLNWFGEQGDAEVVEFIISADAKCQDLWYFKTADHAKVFKYLLDNCPLLEKVEVTADVWTDTIINPRQYAVDLLSTMSCKWPHLTTLTVDVCLNSQDSHLRGIKETQQDSVFTTICKTLKQLRCLKVTLDLTTLSMKDVKAATSLNYLCDLHLLFDVLKNGQRVDNAVNSNEKLNLVVQMAGRLKQLKYLNLYFFHDETYAFEIFISMYYNLFQLKKLHLDSCSLNLSKRAKNIHWPPGLSLRELSLEGKTQTLYLKGCLRAVERLVLVDTSVAVIVDHVALYGATLNSLSIQQGNAQHKGKQLNLSQILSKCPVLRELDISCLNQFVNYNEIGTLKPDPYRNMEKFSLKQGKFFDTQNRKMIVKLYKEFYTRSKTVLKKLDIVSCTHLEAIREMLVSPLSRVHLRGVEEVEIQEIRAGAFHLQVLTALALMVEHLPLLKKVSIHNFEEDFPHPQWLCKVLNEVGIEHHLFQHFDNSENVPH